MNPKEYDIAVKEFSRRIYYYLLKLIKSASCAEDLTQDCFLYLWNNKEKVELDKVKSWLFTTAHNLGLNFLKREARIEYNDALVAENESTTSDRYETKEIIAKALDGLSPDQRAIILLRDIEGYNYKEIGEIMNLSEAVVKARLFRVRKKIKNIIQQLLTVSQP